MLSKTFTTEQAKEVSKILNIDFSKAKFTLEDFTRGMNVELEHGTKNPATNVTNDNSTITGKIALAHLTEFGDYYQRLGKMEKEAEGKI